MSVDFTDMMAHAAASTAHRDWGAAADAYAAAAHLAGMRGRVPEAWQAWRAAGECWRRADRPGDAERCLRRALKLTELDGSAAAATAPALAAVLGDVGHLEAGEDLLESVAAEQAGRRLPASFVDTRVGLLIQLGRKEAARVLLANLEPADGDEHRARAFRQAQLHALDGALHRARRVWRGLLADLRAEGDDAAGRAVSALGLAEVELLRGEDREALDLFEVATVAARAAGRESLCWQAEAGRVRAMVALGIEPLPGLLDRGLEWAGDRDLRPLEARLRMARAMACAGRHPDAAADDLQVAMDLAMQTGQPLLVGRAAFERAVRLPGTDAERQTLLETAAMAVVSHVPLAARVALARARLLARFDPGQARAVARACLPGLERMGLSRELLAARHLVRQLGG